MTVTVEDVRAFAMTLPRTAEALVRAESAKFLMPKKGDLRYNWLEVRLDAIDQAEMRELVLDAWRMCVPKRLAAACDPTL